MKFHLPLSLRKALMGVLAACAVPTMQAAIMHSSVSSMTYMDFGQNMGRYVADGYENALLSHIRQQAGGAVIYYGDDKYTDFLMPHGMIDFASQNDGGYGAAVGINFYATVRHNATHTNTYTGNYIGGNNAIVYQSIEYRASNKFLLTPSQDFKISRQSKILTDVAAPAMYGANDADPDATWQAMREGSLAGEYLYRTGSGRMEATNPDGSKSYVYGPYQYSAGGMATITRTGGFADDGAFVTYLFMRDYTDSGVNETYPLPVAILAGDSGSPSWVWNEQTQAYEYLASGQAGDFVSMSHYRGAPEWATKTMDSFSVRPDLAGVSEVHIGAVNRQGDTYTDDYERTTTTWYGTVTDGTDKLADFIGMKTGVNTWKDLSGLKDTDNWYHYGKEYLTTQQYEDYFFTENLVFKATAETTGIVADRDVDLGVGYIQLSKGEGLERARFNIGGNHLINSAGYVVDKGVDAYITLANPADYMREWRAVVDADATLHIEGNGNTNAFLNLGGQGTTYLNRTGGHAAYNVLVNNGAKVVIGNTNQIERDFTFGFRGGVLDMNGNSLTWNNNGGASNQWVHNFTIHALDEYATVTNSKGTSFLYWNQGGEQTWLGSFTDEKGAGVLQFAYDGGADGVLTMRSSHTELLNSNSGIQVYSGTLRLAGTNTIHGKGSIDGKSANRYFSNEDWHYVDSTSNVTVAGGKFELGSHARLTGDVSVGSGAEFIMREGVKHQYEYVEGGILREDTYQYADFYGLKGNIANNGTLRIEYSEGTTASNTYAGDISGKGSLGIDLGMDGGKLVLAGNNTMTGTREVKSGTVVLDNAGALGSATGENAWKIGEKAVLAARNADQTGLMGLVHTDSAGALALTADVAPQFAMGGHHDVFLGAEEGKVVQYGTVGTAETLDTWHTQDGRNQWLLGGGGGELVVNWKLSGDNDLVLGNAYMSGTVTLTNTDNDFSGKVVFTKGSNVALVLKDQTALGNGRIDLSYGNSMAGSTNIAQMFQGSIDPTSEGVLMLDRALDTDIAMPETMVLAMGVHGRGLRYTGNISVAGDQAYRFGGPGSLVLANSLQANGCNDMIVDAQGFATGSLVLDAAAQITGDVTVMGHDVAKETASGITGGAMALVLNVDNALASAASVTAKDGGTLLVAAGSSQQMNTLGVQKDGVVLLGEGSSAHVADLQMASGGVLTSAVPEKASLEVEAGALAGSLQVGSFSKVGSGALTASGTVDLNAGTLEVLGGSLKLSADATVKGTVRLHEGSTVNFNGKSLNANLDVAAGKTAAIAGNMSLAGANAHLASGGTLDVSSLSTVNLSTPAWTGMTFGGTVKLGNTTLTKPGDAKGTSFSFNNLQVVGNASLKETKGNSVWTINSLNGSGRLTWAVSNTESLTAFSGSSSVLRFTGAGDFDGSVVIDRGGAPVSSTYAYRTMAEIAHDQALQNADISMRGVKSAYNGDFTDRAALAINTANAHIKGLSNSDGFAVLYAGAAVENAKAGVPVSSRQATLTFTGDGDYSYAGAVAGNDGAAENAKNGLSLVMAGTGTQTFSAAVNVQDVTVQSGTLAFSNAGSAVNGSTTIGQGGTLSIAGGLTLGTDKVLSVTAVDGQGGSANLQGGLTLAGGQLAFSGLALKNLDSGALLNLSGINAAGGQTGLTINFSDDRYLEEGVSYKLASGDFSALGWDDSAYKGASLQYFNAAFTADSDGLFVTFSHMANVRIWHGTQTEYSWSDNNFASEGLSSMEAFQTRFIFDDNAHKEVKVTGSGGMFIKEMGITGTDYVFKGTGLTVASGKLLVGVGASASFELGVKAYSGVELERGATAEFKNSLTLENNSQMMLNEGSRFIQSASSSSFIMNNTSTGTLEVGAGATVNINRASGNAKYRLEGEGAVNLNATGAYSLDSRGNEFEGKLSISLGGNVTMQDGVFAQSSYPDIDLRGGSASTALRLGATLAGKTFDIGALSGDSSTARILAVGENTALAVHQEHDTTFAGTFAKADASHKDAGLVMNGTGKLTLTGANESSATLVVNSGTVALGGDNGKWSGDVTVNTVGCLLLQRNNAIADDRALTVDGVIELGNGVTLTHDVTVTGGKASLAAAAGATATMGGAFVLDDASPADHLDIDKTGAGTVKLTGDTTTLCNLAVAEGTLELALPAGSSEWLGAVSVASGATFSLNAAMSLTTPIDNAGTVNFLEGASFSLSMADFVDGRYDIVTGAGTTTGSLSLGGNFDIAGAAGKDISLQGMGTGELYLLWSKAADTLVWNGSSDSTWGGSNWQDESGKDTSFVDNAEVIFTEAGNKAVAVAEEGVTVASMTISGKDYEFTGGNVAVTRDIALEADASATVENDIRVSGGLSMADGASLTVTSAGSVSTPIITVSQLANEASAPAAVLTKVSINEDLVKGLTGSMIENALVSWNANTVRFQNVTIAATTLLGKGVNPFALSSGDPLTKAVFADTTLMLGTVNTTISSSMLGAAIEVEGLGTITTGSELCTVVVGNLDVDSFSGSLMLNVTDIMDQIAGSDYFVVDFQAASIDSGTSIQAVAGLYSPAIGYIKDDSVYFRTLDVIPEPATATLSMLALGALALRRRRRRAK